MDLSRITCKTFEPFDNQQQWDLANWLLFPTPLSADRMKKGAVETYASWIAPGCGFKSSGDFKRRVESIPIKGGEWKSAYVRPGAQAPAWAPSGIEFWKRDRLQVLQDIVGDVRLAPHMKWAPERHRNSKGERIYSELWTGNWWWEMQVYF